MLDYFCIFTKGGVLLWAMSFTALKGDPVNSLIRTCLLEERSGEASFAYTSPSGGAYTLRWALNNALGLVFVAVYQRALKLAYVGDLLDRASRVFSPSYKVDCFAYPGFDAPFQRMLRECEARADAAKRPSLAAGTVATAQQATKHVNGAAKGASATSAASSESEDATTEEEGNDERAPALPPVNGAGAGDSDSSAAEDSAASGTAFNASLLSKKKMGRRTGPGPKAAARSTKEAQPAKPPAKKPTKQARRWDAVGMSAGGGEEGAQLDFTDGTAGERDAEAVSDLLQPSLVDVEEEVAFALEDDSAAQGGGGGGGLLSSFVRSVGVNVMGTGALQRSDIAPALVDMKRKLMERNVAEEIAEK